MTGRTDKRQKDQAEGAETVRNTISIKDRNGQKRLSTLDRHVGKHSQYKGQKCQVK